VVLGAALAPADLCEQGPARARLWWPSPFLQEAIERLRALAPRGAAPGRAMDLACGSGREAVHLAACGYDVDALDRLPDALERARDLAQRSGVRLRTIRRDLKRRPALPEGPYDLVAVFRFLLRPALGVIREAVAPGGFIVYETFHRRDPGRQGRPLGPSHTVADGELAAAFEGFEVLLARDGVEHQGRIFSQLLARRGKGS
jgi:SAM-dependent methyltransferase